MKKLIFILPVFLAFGLVLPAFAATGQQVQQQIKISPSPTGNQIKNQNQVKTQNQGEEQQIQTQTQEQENLEEGQGEGLQNRNQNAVQNMSIVAQKVQELLRIRTTGGIGDQVRQIAREQNQAQTQIQDNLNKLENRSGLLKRLFGPEYKAIKNLNQQMEQNRLRIQQLQPLQNQVTNQADETQLSEAIQALVEQNTSLEKQVQAEEQVGSVFGWLIRLFYR